MKTCRALFLLILCVVIACKDDDGDQYPVLTLDGHESMRASISWSKVPAAQGYKIWRNASDINNNSFDVPAIIAIVDANTLSFVDQGLPVGNTVNYYVTATIGSVEMKSNVITTQGRVTFEITPRQMAVIPGTKQAVVRTNNEIVVVDYEVGIIFRRLSFPSTIGTFALARYGGTWELYVPCADGNVYICDAGDLVILETLPAGSDAVSVAVNSKGWIAVSCSNYYEPLKIYHRETLTQFGSITDLEILRSRLFFQSDHSLITVTAYTSPAVMSLYTLDDQAGVLSKIVDPYGWEYDISADPAGISDKYAVTSHAGLVFSLSDLNYRTTLSAGGTDQMDFQFSDDGNTIYSSISVVRNILKSVIANGQVLHTEKINTVGYPWLLFRDADEMVVLSAPLPFSSYAVPSRVIIETVSLK